MKLGIGLVPEDRKRSGAFLHMSIVWNTSISCLKKLMKWGIVVDTKKERKLGQEYVDKLRTCLLYTSRCV